MAWHILLHLPESERKLSMKTNEQSMYFLIPTPTSRRHRAVDLKMQYLSRNERAEKASASNLTKIPAWKRFLDVAFVLLSLPLVLPVMLLVMALIKHRSTGPVLFKQERIGFHGKRFYCYKFRTMHISAESNSHESYLKHLMESDVPMAKLDSQADPRVIPGGLILRSSGMDELPQLINVLRGEMSLVGPRPCLPYEYANYLPGQKERFNAAPGLTGLWQVSGKNHTTFAEMIRLDIDYTRRQSLLFDLKIMLKTFPVLINQIRETEKRKQRPSRTTRPGLMVNTRSVTR
jgi:lipopolysaccharide/colanic/teichoic acid biosynthesis glycosyltransferase